MSQTVSLGARVRGLRRRQTMSQGALARAVGISPSYLNLIESGRRPMPAHLMFQLAAALKVEVSEFAVDEGSSLQQELLSALEDPVFDEAEIRAPDVADLVQHHPAIARAMALLWRRYHSGQESLEKLSSLVSESGGVGGFDTSRLPSEEVNDLIQRHLNHFPSIEEAAERLWERHKLTVPLLFESLERLLRDEHGVTVRIVSGDQAGVIRRYDPEARVLSLWEAAAPRSWHFQMAHQIGLLTLDAELDAIAEDPQITTSESRRLARMVLANYFAGALLMPYEAFLSAAREVRYDVELLGHRFRTSFEQVCHRLSCMQRPGREGIRFHFVKTDTAGNVSKRFSGSGISFARFAGGCPRWNVCTAFQTPGRIRTQVSVMPDGARYFCIARTVEKRLGGYRAAETLYGVGIGCRIEHAKEMIYAEGIDLAKERVIPIGTHCRVCDRLDCEQRAFPSIRHKLELDENMRRIAFYAMPVPEGGR
jgi:predicted transcriptional regulator/transcriptional regulator with XRE-family HTH domain